MNGKQGIILSDHATQIPELWKIYESNGKTEFFTTESYVGNDHEIMFLFSDQY